MSNVVRLGDTGFFAIEEAEAAWRASGCPPLADAGRLYGDQKYLFTGWVNRLPGFNPADNPDDETQRLAHVRFAAFDLANPKRDRAACEAAGLIFPYSYEPWHCELPNVKQYPIVRSLPTVATTGAVPIEPFIPEEQDMSKPIAYAKGDADPTTYAIYLDAGANNAGALTQGGVYCARRYADPGEFKIATVAGFKLVTIPQAELDAIPKVFGSR